MSKIYRIGRLSSNDICLNHADISRSHADLTVFENGTYLLFDHSTNGTYVNGRRVCNASTTVSYGDRIVFANQIPLDWCLIQHEASRGGATVIMAPQPAIQQPIAPQPVPSTESNVMAILGLVFAFIVPLVGLILSCLGLKKAKGMGGKGHGLALAGLVVSAVLMVLNLVYIIALLS